MSLVYHSKKRGFQLHWKIRARRVGPTASLVATIGAKMWEPLRDPFAANCKNFYRCSFGSHLPRVHAVVLRLGLAKRS